jgi:hypothetical protein
LILTSKHTPSDNQDPGRQCHFQNSVWEFKQIGDPGDFSNLITVHADNGLAPPPNFSSLVDIATPIYTEWNAIEPRTTEYILISSVFFLGISFLSRKLHLLLVSRGANNPVA